MDAAFPLTQTPGPTEWECFLSSLDPVFMGKSLDYIGTTTEGIGIEETCVDTPPPPPLPPPRNFLPCPLETTQPDLLELIHQPSALAAPTTKSFDTMPDAVSRKLSYALDEIKKVPAMMVLETQTPWCHPRLYEEHMPRSMQGTPNFICCPYRQTPTNLRLYVDAHAACALYMAKNRANARVILRSIDARVSDLIASPPPTTPLGILARTQSLILYHIIRVFDGDIAARAAAEDTQSALEDAAMSLILHTDFDCPSPAKLAAASSSSSHQLPLQPFGPTKRFFQDWVFQESARRTLLFIFFFLQAYRIIRGHRVEACDGRLNRCHAFTLSAALWEADGPLAFARAWGARRHLVVENTNFQIAFQEARADEIDAFGRIMLTSVIGVDEAEGWFAARGGSLRGNKVAV
jgi:hypothetical protein